jgi:hypothetical protein
MENKGKNDGQAAAQDASKLILLASSITSVNYPVAFTPGGVSAVESTRSKLEAISSWLLVTAARLDGTLEEG